MKNKGAIVILGGMGPEASAKMLEVMVSMAAKEFGAKDGSDFPEIIVDSIPVPDFISNKENVNLALEMLKKRVKDLENLDVSCFAIACNTAHILLPTLEAISAKPFVSMIDAVASNVANRRLRTVGLMATPTTINSRLFQRAFKKFGVVTILPSINQISDMERVIRKVIAGNNSQADSQKLATIANSLKTKGAETIILGCSELPLAFPKSFPIPILDSIEVLSRAILTRFFTRR